MADNVIDLRRQPHLTCACGSTWWTSNICLEQRVGGYVVTGHQVPLRCQECGAEVTP